MNKKRVVKGSVSSRVGIDKQDKLLLDNIVVWRFARMGLEKYKISTPGLTKHNCNDRIMIKGKKKEFDFILKNTHDYKVTYNYITDMLSIEEQVEYLQLLYSNNIRGCIKLLRDFEKRLNLSCDKDSVKVLRKGM